MPYRPIKQRRITVWLDRANWPVNWTMRWYLDRNLHTELGGWVSVGIDAAELVAILDQLPVGVDPSVIDQCQWAQARDDAWGECPIDVELPGWKETQAGTTWHLPAQLPLPL